MVDFLDNLRDELVSSIYSSLFRERPGQWAAIILKIIIIMWTHLQRINHTCKARTARRTDLISRFRLASTPENSIMTHEARVERSNMICNLLPYVQNLRITGTF